MPFYFLVWHIELGFNASPLKMFAVEFFTGMNVLVISPFCGSVYFLHWSADFFTIRYDNIIMRVILIRYDGIFLICEILLLGFKFELILSVRQCTDIGNTTIFYS
jgi:hypothetical protein